MRVRTPIIPRLAPQLILISPFLMMRGLPTNGVQATMNRAASCLPPLALCERSLQIRDESRIDVERSGAVKCDVDPLT